MSKTTNFKNERMLTRGDVESNELIIPAEEYAEIRSCDPRATADEDNVVLIDNAALIELAELQEMDHFFVPCRISFAGGGSAVGLVGIRGSDLAPYHAAMISDGGPCTIVIDGRDGGMRWREALRKAVPLAVDLFPLGITYSGGRPELTGSIVVEDQRPV